MGKWITTVSGKRVFPLKMKRDDIDIKDIAHALGKICRFGGHSKQFYSVAEHAVWVSKLVPTELALFGLCHDNAEAYLGDIVSPIKTWLNRWYENRLLKKFYDRYVIIRPSKKANAEVKYHDRVMLATEGRQLMKSPELNVSKDAPGPNPEVLLHCWDHEEARDRFLARWYELT